MLALMKVREHRRRSKLKTWYSKLKYKKMRTNRETKLRTYEKISRTRSHMHRLSRQRKRNYRDSLMILRVS